MLIAANSNPVFREIRIIRENSWTVVWTVENIL